MKSYTPPPLVRLAIALVIASAPIAAYSESVSLRPVADTSLFSNAPDNNVGGNLSLAVGNTARVAPIRGLIRFDTAAIPLNARIIKVSLQLQVVQNPGGPVSAMFDLHRMLVGWEEGAGGAGGGIGTGSPANAGETTWNSRLHGSSPWTISGGASGRDFASAASSSAANATSEPIGFDSTDELVADVQAWVNNPDSNFGWLMKDRIEGVASTARRLASREDAARAPLLTIEFVSEPALSVAAALDGNGNICLRFIAKPGKLYRLQRRGLIDSGDWTTVATRAPDEIDGTATLCDPLITSSASNFYRVSEE